MPRPVKNVFPNHNVFEVAACVVVLISDYDGVLATESADVMQHCHHLTDRTSSSAAD